MLSSCDCQSHRQRQSVNTKSGSVEYSGNVGVGVGLVTKGGPDGVSRGARMDSMGRALGLIRLKEHHLSKTRGG